MLLIIIAELICDAGNSVMAQTQTSEFMQGVPRIIHYSKKEFNADPQFWTMCQDKNGVLYFGNNDGTLVFDGERWQKVYLPNNSSVRSLKANNFGEIYAGGFNELGVIKRNDQGKYYYKSLLNLLRPEDRNLENIWQIHEVQGYMVFRSSRMLIAITNNKAVTIPTTTFYRSSAVVNNQLYVMDDEGIKKLDLRSMEFTEVVKQAEFHGEEIASLLPDFKDQGLLLITKQGSAYALDGEKHNATFLKRLIPQNSSNLIICGIKSSGGKYYFGTLSTKVILLDAFGEQIIADEAFQSLQDKTVLNLFQSKDGNIWALLNNGIDCIDISSPMSIVFENAAIFDVVMVKNKIYLATNQGVFVSEISTSRKSRSGFKKIEGLEGQAWTLQYFNGQIICSHDRGLFLISDTGIKKIPDIIGVWKVIPIKDKPGYFFACTYDAIYVLRFDPVKGFELQNKLEGFNESSRDIIQSDEPGVFWICHGYKGVFRIKVNEKLTRAISLEHFKDQNGLPSAFSNNVFSWKDEIIFTTNHGLFTFNEKTNQFQLQESLTKLFGKELNVRKLYQRDTLTWFVHGDEAGYFNTESPNPILHKDLFLSLKGSFNQGMECIVPIGDSQVLLGTNTGLYAFNLKFSPSDSAQTQIENVRAVQKEGAISGTLKTTSSSPFQLVNGVVNIHFDFASPDFQDRMNVEYSYKLENIESQWSAWQENPFKEFSYLRPGQYVFHVKARSLLGEHAAEALYYFEILPAWYQTRIAYALYILSACVLLVTIINLVKRKILKETEKTRDEEFKKRQVLELELEQIKLKQEKEQITKDKEQLEEDVIHKSKELANYTMLLVKKRELLSDMHEDLKVLKETLRQDSPRQMVRDIIKKITANLQNEEHIKVFEANFERVHHEFFSQLKSTFPDLTSKELQLCAFVRMNLTNKEIASILNISVRGVETARYRLRKRLGMSQEQDMTAFLDKLHSAGDKTHADDEEEVS
ncbi:MAG TPA: triple tyrosine motif-containing protein [Chryseolinea sp.]|nr:triple tyrosine motif-containing protein [Chryseolinea sp.]